METISLLQSFQTLSIWKERSPRKSFEKYFLDDSWKKEPSKACLYIDLEEKIIETSPLELIESLYPFHTEEEEEDDGDEEKEEGDNKEQITKEEEIDQLETSRRNKEKRKKKIRVVCISDTHGLHNEIPIPNGDILVHCGDINILDWGKKLSVLNNFNVFLGKLPHKHKYVIAGNHDGCCASNSMELVQNTLSNCIYLCNSLNLPNSSPTSSPLSVYGSPVSVLGISPNRAFQFPKDSDQIAQQWNNIPPNLDLLLTHNPPEGSLISTIRKTKPRVHIHGHIHKQSAYFSHNGHTLHIGAASLDDDYLPNHSSIVLDMYPPDL